jgi:prepilin-type N-terminal cleavage/methylation domain-containing protein
MKRKGFTLIELVVAMAIFFILIYMAFASFSYILAFSNYNRQRENVQENISTVMDQITKEMKQTYTQDDGSGEYGIAYPQAATIRFLNDIVSPDPPLSDGQYYNFKDSDPDDSDPNNPILQFYIIDQNETKHKISYTLGIPNDGNGYHPPHYQGIPRRYWANAQYEPCEILYSNQTKDADGNWTGITDQPVTEQVITNFAVIRPDWSDKVIQVIIEAMVKAPTSKGYEKVRYINQITLRQ